MQITRLLSAIALYLLLTTSAAAAEPAAVTLLNPSPSLLSVGLTLNSLVPELNAVDAKGNPMSLAKLSGEKGLVLVFFRSADWCPFCKKHLIEINQRYAEIQALGYQVAAISYDSLDILRDFATKMQINYPLLADQQTTTMQRYQVLHADYQPGMRHYGIPYPGVMVINTKQELKAQYFYEGYKQRVNLDTLITALSAIK